MNRIDLEFIVDISYVIGDSGCGMKHQIWLID